MSQYFHLKLNKACSIEQVQGKRYSQVNTASYSTYIRSKFCLKSFAEDFK